MIYNTSIRPNRRLRLISLVNLLALSLTAGCVTSQKRSKQQQPAAITQKPGSKESTPTQTPQTPAKSETPPPPSVEQQLKFFSTHVTSDTSFGEDDIYFLSTIPSSPEAGSVSEAVITIGILRGIINPNGATIKPTFEEQDLSEPEDAPQNAPARTGPSVQKLFKERNVDLADALAENPLLGTHAVANMVRHALTLGSDSPDYQAEIVNILRKTAQKWSDLNRGFGGEVPTDAAPVEPKLMTDTYGNVYDANAPKAGDESAITEAQRLADAGRFQDAIKVASSIGKSHPSHALAQEKIKDYSNKAVQNLRKKAAAAFQSAMPITDSKVRAQYLRQAKGFLEEALKDYPQATQLPTVRDNLRIISRDLEKLDTEAGG